MIGILILLGLLPILTGLVAFPIGVIIGLAIWYGAPWTRGWVMLVISFLLALLSFWVGVNAWLIGVGQPDGSISGIPLRPALIGLLWGLFLALLYRKIRPVTI
ncbi:MAG: hypothetical protein AB1644_02485 [Candidatus Zixiibacteriota bacterium]